jgi:hypothetical protein
MLQGATAGTPHQAERDDIAIWSCSPVTAIAGKTPQERRNRRESYQQFEQCVVIHTNDMETTWR